jgi:hypothetical protein
VLDLAKSNGVRSVAFCCVSTGLFNYPSDIAADVAVETTRLWLAQNDGSIDLILFDVFTAADLAAYRRHLPPPQIRTAARWIAAADSVLFVAGAGMSAYPAPSLRNVYVDPASFQEQYVRAKRA